MSAALSQTGNNQFFTLPARLLTAVGLVWEAARTQLMKEKQKVNTLHETNREGMKNLRQLRYTMFHQVVSEKMIFPPASGSNSVLLGICKQRNTNAINHWPHGQPPQRSVQHQSPPIAPMPVNVSFLTFLFLLKCFATVVNWIQILSLHFLKLR